jgi:multidrug efflux pump
MSLGTVLTLFVVPTAYLLIARRRTAEEGEDVPEREELVPEPAEG